MKTLSSKPQMPGVSLPHSLAHSLHHVDLLHALNRLGQLVLTWQGRVRERAHLAQLDPHLRRDAGLSDAQIAEEVRKPFWLA